MKINAQISEEASEWFVEFRMGETDVAGRKAFDSWIRSSPEHLRAYLEIAAIWNEGASMQAHRDLSSDGLIALAHTPGNVVSFDFEPPRVDFAAATDTSLRRLPARWPVSLAAVLSLFLLGSVFVGIWQMGREPVYATSVGERRVLRLDDGSTVELNSRSRVRVQFSKDQRKVELLAGQALFQVAKDAHRPFIVYSDELHVRAIGTQFDVNRKSTGIVVTVVEGRVAVLQASEVPVSQASVPQPGPEAYPAILLSAGDQLTFSDATPRPQPRHASPTATIAWTQGQLVLESASLADVAEEFNRYSRRHLTVADHGEQPLRLSGVFATDPDFLLRYLRQRPDITVQETATDIHIIHQGLK
jgi:transmembrane sensor